MDKEREVAEGIVDALTGLEDSAKVIDKIKPSYTELQIRIVLNHIKRLRE